ncbi:MAG: hypothetical protein RMJ65_01730 [candidate division WOR-3 bacterium]|nr:hypothetical protein [candidate division WOR-3 bacterium]MDW7987420.1 hypothetical protein [candidate division WOR-3 bacterium]
MKKKIDLDKIIDDFITRLINGEKITVDEVLAQYPQYAKKLKPLLEIELSLLALGRQLKELSNKEFPAYDQEIWDKLEKTILDKELKKLKKISQTLKVKSQLPLRYPYEFILLLLYVKGYRSQVAEGIRGITRIIKTLFLVAKLTTLPKLLKNYYKFVPYKLGPFDPKIYQDLKLLQSAGFITTQKYKYSKSPLKLKSEINSNYLDEGTIYKLTSDGVKYAQALAQWCEKKDPEILLNLRRIKANFTRAPLKKLLKYIYEHYPEYTTESEVLKQILNS